MFLTLTWRRSLDAVALWAQSLTPRQVSAIYLAAVAAGVAVLYSVDPESPGQPFFCIFHAVTGYYCPGCGSMRAMHALLHGDLLAALGFNPMAVCCLPFLSYPFGSNMAVVLTGRPWKTFTVPALPVLWMVLAFWVLRNIPFFPFVLLAPHRAG
jgi:hypothetical protein